MAREVTCIFIAVYTVILIVGLVRLSQGREAYEAFLLALASPASVAFHLLALAFAVYHSVTWFNLAPKALPLHMGDKTVAPGAIAAAHYIAWVVISVVVLAAAGVF
jgi:fumarate reductase subunit C